MNALAERYVKTVLALGHHDTDYVDAYYGPPEWKTEADGDEARPRHDRGARADAPRRPEEIVPAPARGRDDRGCAGSTSIASSPRSRRASGCSKASGCRSTRSRRRCTTRWRRPTRRRTSRRSSTAREALPGPGLARRALRRLAQPFVIPREKLDTVFQTAINACRERTLAHVTLPPGEQLHRRVRHEQVVERLQLVSGQLPQPDPGQHRSADLHRPRDRSRLPRRLSRATTSTTRCSRSTWCTIAAGSSSPSIRSSRRSR